MFAANPKSFGLSCDSLPSLYFQTGRKISALL